jgi:CBS domain-containing protein
MGAELILQQEGTLPAGAHGSRGADPAIRGRWVAHVMTLEVVTARPGEPVHEAARRMAKHGVGALPVVEGAHVVGILTASDLTMRLVPHRRLSWWQLFVDTEKLARTYRKAMGPEVRDVMSAPAVTVAPTASIEEAAALLATHGIGRLPVVTGGGLLVGIVSRTDLLPMVGDALPAAQPRTDAEIVADMRARLAGEAWISTGGLWVDARSGVLELWGLVDSEAECRTIGVMARTVPGVRGIENHVIARSRLPVYAG